MNSIISVNNNDSENEGGKSMKVKFKFLGNHLETLGEPLEILGDPLEILGYCKPLKIIQG